MRAVPVVVLLLAACGEAPELPPGDEVSVFIFLAPDCPVSNRYAPELARLHGRFSGKPVSFRAVYPGARWTEEQMRLHAREYGIRFEVFPDRDLKLVRRAGVGMTPEAAVHVRGRGFVYRGRIDDRQADVGVLRPEAGRRDLEAAIEAALAGTPPLPAGGAVVGCPILP